MTDPSETPRETSGSSIEPSPPPAPLTLVVRLHLQRSSEEDARAAATTYDGAPDTIDWIEVDDRRSPDGAHAAVDAATIIGRLNDALALARKRRCDVLVLADTAPLQEDDLRHMRGVAETDPMIAFVVPPRMDGVGAAQLASAVAVAPIELPRLRYAPSSAAPRIFVKGSVLVDLGDLDPGADDVMAALADLMARANRYGYRTAIATAASMARSHPSAVSSRIPEVARAEHRFDRSPETEAERLLQGLRPTPDGRLRVAFDCTPLTKHHAGTSEATRRLLGRAVPAWADAFEIHVICPDDVFRFHGFDAIPDLRQASPDDYDVPFAAVIRVGQFFSAEALADLRRRALVSVVTMLDTIALDCAGLDEADLQRLWQDGADAADALVFISAFSRQQFERRFRLGADTIAETVPLSLDPADYRGSPEPADGGRDGPLLVVGNHFDHKAVRETAVLLAAATSPASIVLLGHSSIEEAGIRGLVSGQLDASLVDRLYCDARAVVFPSHYEGFGFPVMHALARRKPVVARNLPPFREIAEATGLGTNLHLVESTQELIARAAERDLRWAGDPLPDLPHLGWSRCAAGYRHVLEAAFANLSYDRLVARISVGQKVRREREASQIKDALASELALRRGVEAARAAELVQYVAVEAHLQDVEADRAAVARLVAALSDQNQALNARNEEIAADLERLARTRNAMLASTSWRMTAPLRKAATAARTLRDPATFARLVRRNLGLGDHRPNTDGTGEASPVSRTQAESVSPLGGPAKAGSDRSVRPASADGLRRERARVFVDVTFIAAHDHGTGIQRVVRSIVGALLAMESSLCVEPVAVRLEGDRLVTAHRFAERTSGQSKPADDTEVEFEPGDTLLMLDSSWFDHERFRPIMERARRNRAMVYSVVYDLIPLLHPETTYDGLHAPFAAWFAAAVAGSDGMVCISRAVADEVRSFIDREQLPHDAALRIGAFHLGAELPSGGGDTRPELRRALSGNGPVFLMVGTLEPRKGHATALSAMERLWVEERDVTLCILGKTGWGIEDLATQIRSHREAGRRLYWIPDATDSEISRAYRGSSALLFPSLAEGFGLPVVEAARAGLPVLCSDIPVLREVAGDNALYFTPGDPAALAGAMRRWLDGRARPDPSGIRTISWRDSARELLAFVSGRA